MIDGCVAGGVCPICDNTGLGCNKKNVIYSMECLECKENKDSAQEGNAHTGTEASQTLQMKTSMYIGETSRPCRARAIEHLKNAADFKQESFIVQHWSSTHGNMLDQPRFEFKVVKSCTDALSRQVGEAVHILLQGNLNSKFEFGINHLCRLVPDKEPWVAENDLREEEQSRQKANAKLRLFIKELKERRVPSQDCDLVNKNDKKKVLPVGADGLLDPNVELCYRYFKKKDKIKNRESEAQEEEPAKKKIKAMDTSTPVATMSRRNIIIPSPELSPEPNVDTGLPKPFILEGSDHVPSDSEATAQKSATGASLDLDKNAITPTKRMENSDDMDGGANALMNVAIEAGVCFQVDQMDGENDQEPLPIVGSDNSDAPPIVGSDNSDAPPVDGGNNATSQQVDELLQSLELSSNPSFGTNNNENGMDGKNVQLTADEEGSPSTPKNVRKKLFFGSNLTPEIAHLRATPMSTPTKRRLDEADMVVCGSASKRLHTTETLAGKSSMCAVVEANVEGIAPLSTTTNVQTPPRKNLVGQLLCMRGRSMSTPAGGKGRARGRKLSSTPKGRCHLKQQRIPDLIRSGQKLHKNSEEGGILSVEGSDTLPTNEQASHNMCQGGTEKTQ